ncbi:MAG: PilZ domain-containing protein [Anaerolineales bacterium]|nr:PilZ domain-containing protein [Anaerolineales bacterium]
MQVESIDIFTTLAYIAAQRRSITLLTNFRGVPIKIRAHMMRLNRLSGQLHLLACQRQVVALRPDQAVLLQSELFPRPVTARIARLDLQRQTLVLQALAYSSGSVGQRVQPRVQPESPLSAELRLNDGFTLKGRVIDLSPDGLSVSLPSQLLPLEQPCLPGCPLEIALGLPGWEGQIVDLQLPAQVAYRVEDVQLPGYTRLGLLTQPNEHDQMVLRRYLFDRQTVILAEIQALNQGLLEVVTA